MTTLEIIILAIIQGLTEFLPISSSGHLILPSALLGWSDQGLAFDVAVHVGSLLAVMIYLRKDIFELTIAWGGTFKGQKSPQGNLAWWVILATIPAVVFGYTFKDWIEVYARSAEVIAFTTILFGMLLWAADRWAKHNQTMVLLGWKKALLIGLSQALAIIPGTSRSGITMTTGLALGLKREEAARFSFLLSIPVIAGAGILSVYDLIQDEAAVDWQALWLGAVLSFVSAYTCIYLFLAWISRIGMTPFVLYRLALGAVLVAFITLG